MRFADYGLNMPSFGLFASEEKLAARGEAIGRFASIVSRTWEYIYAGHEDEAADAIIAQRPQARLDRAVLRGQIDALKGYFGKPQRRSANRPTGAGGLGGGGEDARRRSG